MTKYNFTERVDFTYFIGFGESLILFNLSMFFYNKYGLPMILSLVCLFTYVGVLIRGMIDQESWGKTEKQKRISAYIGFNSMFAIFLVIFILMLFHNFNFTQDTIKNILMYGGTCVIVLYTLLFILWFRKLTFN